MTKFAFINENNVVIHVRPSMREGFVEVPDHVVCDMIFQDGEFVNPPIVYSWDDVRQKRNSMLQKSDWTQLVDSPLSPESREEYVEYRQSLRDVTEAFDTANEAMDYLVSLESGE